MRMLRKDFGCFLQDWEEYEVTLTRILPRSIFQGDMEIGEEVNHLLSCRDKLEEDFTRFTEEPKLIPYHAELSLLDGELLRRRYEILSRISIRDYRNHRRRNAARRSHWWWYLDEIDRVPNHKVRIGSGSAAISGRLASHT